MRALLVIAGPADRADREVRARRLPALLAALRLHDSEVSVALLGDPVGLADDLRPVAAQVTVLPGLVAPEARSLGVLPTTVRRLRSVIEEARPDVIEGHEPLPAIATGLAARSNGAAKVLYRRHHLGGRRPLSLASRVAARVSDYTVVTSGAHREQAARDDRVGAERVLITPSGCVEPRRVKPEEIQEARASLAIPAGAPVVLMVTRPRHEKGLDVLLEAMRLPATTGAHAVVLGVAGANTASNVHLLGYTRDVDLWLATADVVAIPSRRESFGRITVEAMAAGRPVVASRVGGLVEAVDDGRTGSLVEPEDPRALAAALGELLAEPARREQMGASARRKYVERHTIQAMAAGWKTAWCTAVEAR